MPISKYSLAAIFAAGSLLIEEKQSSILPLFDSLEDAETWLRSEALRGSQGQCIIVRSAYLDDAEQMATWWQARKISQWRLAVDWTGAQFIRYAGTDRLGEADQIVGILELSNPRQVRLAVVGASYL